MILVQSFIKVDKDCDKFSKYVCMSCQEGCNCFQFFPSYICNLRHTLWLLCKAAGEHCSSRCQGVWESEASLMTVFDDCHTTVNLLWDKWRFLKHIWYSFGYLLLECSRNSILFLKYLDKEGIMQLGLFHCTQ